MIRHLSIAAQVDGGEGPVANHEGGYLVPALPLSRYILSRLCFPILLTPLILPTNQKAEARR